MRRNGVIGVVLFAGIVGCGVVGNHEVKAQGSQAVAVQQMVITGEIALLPQGYIIRGKVPAELFTILNPLPEILDKISAKGKDVEVLVRIVSGDNVEIEKIDGRDYP